MKKRTSTILSILSCLHAWALFAGLYPFFASLFNFKDAEFWRVTTCALLVFLPVVICHVLLKRLHNLFAYLSVGFLSGALAVLLSYLLGGTAQSGGQFSAVLTAIISLIILVFNTRAKLTFGQKKREFLETHGEKKEFAMREEDAPNFLSTPQPYHWAWLTLLYVPGMFLHFTTFLYCMFWIAFFDVFVCLLHCYIRSLDEYVRQNRSVANFPTRHMRNIHRTTGVVGFVMLLFFLLPAVLYGREFQPDLTTDKPLVSFEEPTQEMYQPIRNSEIADTQFITMMADSGHEAPKWLLALLRFLGYAFFAVLVVFALIALIRKIKSLGEDFAAENEDEIVSLDEENTDESSATSRASTKEGLLSVNQRVRRRYRKTIKKSTKGKPSKCATPSELERDASVHDDRLHTVYEKARYSKEGCSKEDLEHR